MSAKYLFPCEKCEEVHHVEARQAGMIFPCSCGVELEVPPLLELRKLAGESETNDATEPAGWGAREGLLLLGTVIFLGALGNAAFFWNRIPTYQPSHADEKLVREQIDRMTLHESMHYWALLEDSPLRHIPDKNLEAWEEEKWKGQALAMVALIFAGVGLCMVIGGFFVRRAS
ncbi:MAG: hypothetical protein N2C14_31555 [Planctomycetales bacterium]